MVSLLATLEVVLSTNPPILPNIESETAFGAPFRYTQISQPQRL